MRKNRHGLNGAQERIDLADPDDPFQVALHSQRFEFVLKEIAQTESVLEIGTGVGSFSPLLAAHCERYTGVEIDPESAARTVKRLGGKGEVVQCDARNLPFAPESFSAIVCLEVLEHLGDWVAGVNGIRKCLKKDGIAIISVPYRRKGGKSAINRYHLYEPGEDELTACLRQCFAEVLLSYQYFEETLIMQVSRVLHLRRLVGTDGLYGALTRGEMEGISRLRISPKPHGQIFHLLAVARYPRSAVCE